MKLPKKDLQALVERALINQAEKASYFEGASNPQIVEMRNQYLGRIEALEAVKCALQNGDKVLLNILTRP